jgi:hypothetical protein
LLYRTPINGNRLLRWLLLYASLLPAMLVVFGLFAVLGGRWSFVWNDLVAGIPWPAFWVASGALGLVLTALALSESLNNNRLWKNFFHPDPFKPLFDQGFVLDRYGLHGFWKGLPVSIYYEKETLGDYAKITAYAAVSDDVDTLRALGTRFGDRWFFLPDEIEHFLDPPFDRIHWPEALDNVLDLITKQSFPPMEKHPWLRGNAAGAGIQSDVH